MARILRLARLCRTFVFYVLVDAVLLDRVVVMFLLVRVVLIVLFEAVVVQSLRERRLADLDSFSVTRRFVLFRSA